MSDKFLGSGKGSVNISNGSASIYGATLGAASLDTSRPIKTNSVRQLVSSNLEISEINGLNNELANKDVLTFIQDDTQTTPDVGKNKIYFKTDGKFYKLDDQGVETVIGGSIENDTIQTTFGTLNLVLTDKLKFDDDTIFSIGGLGNQIVIDDLSNSVDIENLEVENITGKTTDIQLNSISKINNDLYPLTFGANNNIILNSDGSTTIGEIKTDSIKNTDGSIFLSGNSITVEDLKTEGTLNLKDTSNLKIDTGSSLTVGGVQNQMIISDNTNDVTIDNLVADNISSGGILRLQSTAKIQIDDTTNLAIGGSVNNPLTVSEQDNICFIPNLDVKTIEITDNVVDSLVIKTDSNTLMSFDTTINRVSVEDLEIQNVRGLTNNIQFNNITKIDNGLYPLTFGTNNNIILNSDASTIIEEVKTNSIKNTDGGVFYQTIGGSGLDFIQLGNDFLNNRIYTALNDNGNRVVFGLPDTQVYEWDGVGSWNQLGSNIVLVDPSPPIKIPRFNSDGSVVVIGEPISLQPIFSTRGTTAVYEFDGLNWNFKGSPVIGTTFSSVEGSGVCISNDGNRFATSQNGIAEVRIYEWDGVGTWNQLGSTIVSPNDNNMSLDCNGDLTRVVISSSINLSGGTPFDTPLIHRVYEWNGVSWIQLGADFNSGDESLGNEANSMDDTGNIIALSGKNTSTNLGYTAVYEWNGLTWVQKGTDIVGNTDRFGGHTVLDNTGSSILIADTKDNSDTGYVALYKFETSDWVKKVERFGQNSGDEYGRTAHLSGNGNRFSITGNTSSIEQAKVFDIKAPSIEGNSITIEDLKTEGTLNLKDTTFLKLDDNSSLTVGGVQNQMIISDITNRVRIDNLEIETIRGLTTDVQLNNITKINNDTYPLKIGTNDEININNGSVDIPVLNTLEISADSGGAPPYILRLNGVAKLQVDDATIFSIGGSVNDPLLVSEQFNSVSIENLVATNISSQGVIELKGTSKIQIDDTTNLAIGGSVNSPLTISEQDNKCIISNLDVQNILTNRIDEANKTIHIYDASGFTESKTVYPSAGELYDLKDDTSYVLHGNITLTNGFHFGNNTSITGSGFNVTLTFDESASDICGFYAENQNLFLSNITIVDGGGHFSGSTVNVKGLFDFKNYDTGASAPFYARNKRCRIQNCQIIGPYSLGKIIGGGTIRFIGNFINGNGAVPLSTYTTVGLEISDALSFEFCNNKVVLMAGAQQVSTLKMIDFVDSILTPVELGLNAVIISGNIFHPRDNENGIFFANNSRTQLGTISANTFIRSGGTAPLISYEGILNEDNFNRQAVINYEVIANSGVIDVVPTCRCNTIVSNIVSSAAFADIIFPIGSILALNKSTKRFGLKTQLSGTTGGDYTVGNYIEDNLDSNKRAYILDVQIISAGVNELVLCDFQDTFTSNTNYREVDKSFVATGVSSTNFQFGTGLVAGTVELYYADKDPFDLHVNAQINHRNSAADDEVEFVLLRDQGGGYLQDDSTIIRTTPAKANLVYTSNMNTIQRFKTGDLMKLQIRYITPTNTTITSLTFGVN